MLIVKTTVPEYPPVPNLYDLGIHWRRTEHMAPLAFSNDSAAMFAESMLETYFAMIDRCLATYPASIDWLLFSEVGPGEVEE